MTKLAAIFLFLPLIGAALIATIYSPADTGGIDWSGVDVR